MYSIRKYPNYWILLNTKTSKERRLSLKEQETLKKKFPQLKDPKLAAHTADEIKGLRRMP